MHRYITDAVLVEAANHVGAEPFSGQLAAIAEAWTADKTAVKFAPNLAETEAALLCAGQLRIREVVALVASAAATTGP